MSTETPAIRAIATTIRAIRGTRRSRVVDLDLGLRYFQVASFEGPSLLIEFPSNTYLSDEAQLSTDDEQRLLALGFTHPADDLPNWWIGLEEGTDDDIDNAATRLLRPS